MEKVTYKIEGKFAGTVIRFQNPTPYGRIIKLDTADQKVLKFLFENGFSKMIKENGIQG